MFTKTTKLTRVYSTSQCVAQWCILHPIEDQPPLSVFFTQTLIEDIPFKKLKRIPMALNNRDISDKGVGLKERLEGKKCKFIKLKSFFTDLETGIISGSERPVVEAEMVFEEIGNNYWQPQAVHLVTNFYRIECHFFQQQLFQETGLTDQELPRVRQFWEFYARLTKSWPAIRKKE